MVRFGRKVPELLHAPRTCLSDKYQVTDGYLIPADNQFVDLSLLSKYAHRACKGRSHCHYLCPSQA